jgi:hypothetical protein
MYRRWEHPNCAPGEKHNCQKNTRTSLTHTGALRFAWLSAQIGSCELTTSSLFNSKRLGLQAALLVVMSLRDFTHSN